MALLWDQSSALDLPCGPWARRSITSNPSDGLSGPGRKMVRSAQGAESGVGPATQEVAMKRVAILVISIAALLVAPATARADSPGDNHATYGWVVGFTSGTDTA